MPTTGIPRSRIARRARWTGETHQSALTGLRATPEALIAPATGTQLALETALAWRLAGPLRTGWHRWAAHMSAHPTPTRLTLHVAPAVADAFWWAILPTRIDELDEPVGVPGLRVHPRPDRSWQITCTHYPGAGVRVIGPTHVPTTANPEHIDATALWTHPDPTPLEEGATLLRAWAQMPTDGQHLWSGLLRRPRLLALVDEPDWLHIWGDFTHDHAPVQFEWSTPTLTLPTMTAAVIDADLADPIPGHRTPDPGAYDYLLERGASTLRLRHARPYQPRHNPQPAPGPEHL